MFSLFSLGQHILSYFIRFCVLLIGITFISFILMKAAPGDPTLMYTDPSTSLADMQQVKQNLGLDQPVYIQYFKWLISICQGDFGYSYTSHQPVLDVILDRLPATLILSIFSLILILLVTLPLGLISGKKQNSLFDDCITVGSFFGFSIPSFWLGLMFILLFSLTLNWLPTSGFLDPHLLEAAWWKKSLNIGWHLILPLMTILVGGIAGLTRYHRFGIIHILNQEYIKAARARGISEQRILFKHAFKNAALPIITILGLDLPSLISGSFVIEYVFAWPGLGQLGVQSVFARDYPVLMATLFFSSILIILGNILADLSYRFIDPRIKVSS